MKRPYQITSVVFILFSVFMAQESLGLQYYTLLGPGPGFFPFWLSVSFGLLSGVMLYHAMFKRSDPLPEDFFATRDGYLRMGAIALAVIGVVVLMNPLGFRATALAFLLFLLSALGRQNLIVTVLVALAGSFGTYHVFSAWLQIPLPIGIFGI